MSTTMDRATRHGLYVPVTTIGSGPRFRSRGRGASLIFTSETDDHLPLRLVGLHHAMRLPNVFEAEHSGRLRFVAACRHLLRDGLQRNVGERELRRAEDEAAKEGEVDAARHLQKRVEVG